MKLLGLALALAIALVSAGGPAIADDSQPTPAPKRTPEQQKQLEEQVLKAQVEVYLNQIARWDPDVKRVVLRDPKDAGPLAPTAEVFLGKAAEPIMDGKRLKIKDSVKLEPVMKAVQDFLADGGMEEFQRLEKQRREGGDPFTGGVPPKMLKLVDDIMAALDGGDGERRGERRARGGEPGKTTRVEIRVTGPDGKEYTKTIEVPGDRFTFEFDGEKGDFRFGRGGNGGGNGDGNGGGGRDERMDKLAERAEKAFAEGRRRVEEFMESEDGQRLREEVEKFLDDEEVQRRIQEAQDRVMEFLSSPEGQELQRRFAEFLLSPEGREIRKQIEKLLEGRRGNGDGAPRAQETPRTPETPRAEPRPERRRAQPDERRREERPGGGRLY